MGNCSSTNSAATVDPVTTTMKTEISPPESPTRLTKKKQKEQPRRRNQPPPGSYVQSKSMSRRNSIRSMRKLDVASGENSMQFAIQSTNHSTLYDEESKEQDIDHLPLTSFNLEDTMTMAQLLLETRQDEANLNSEEVKAALLLYKELQRVLSTATRTGNLMAKKEQPQVDTKRNFHDRYTKLVQEMDSAQSTIDKAMANPAAVKPLTAENLGEANDFFILDNSLRETTVGAARGHTMEEKLKIVESMAETGLEEVILGAFGAKVSVDSQIAAQWKRLGKSYDNAWGFSDAYDMISWSEEEQEQLFNSVPEFMQAEERGEGENFKFYTPSSNIKSTYSKADVKLFKEAFKGFTITSPKHPYYGKSPEQVLKEASKESQFGFGRVPLGLLMMAGYGISNACIEIDSSVETFDYHRHDIVARCKYLIQWCKTNLPKRSNVPEGEDNTARVLINLRDFTNYNRSDDGFEEALRLVHELSSAPPSQRPFCFMMEEPTGYLWPDEVGRMCRMIRLTMNRAGFPQGRFLVHIHWYFGLAEATQLTCLCNGADGCWAAVCKVGAQVGHACSTMTAVNLVRAGHYDVTEKYNLGKMRIAAQQVTEISTRSPCPTHEEIIGELAFDIPYIMAAVPACRFQLAKLLKALDIDERVVRLNEIVVPRMVHKAMVYHFGQPEETGWDPSYCTKMYTAIHDHLMTGLSRDYNSALGLGHLYALVSQNMLPSKMVSIMMRNAPVSDYHPTVLDFISRWNRLCLKYEGVEGYSHPVTKSKSIMMWGEEVTVKPRRETLPFEYFLADVMRNPVLAPVPRLFKLQVVSLVTKNERELQGTKVPEIHFYEAVLRLKLFILEAESLGVLGLVDDFCIRKNHDYFFGEDHLWLQKVRGNKPRVLNKMLRSHIDFFPKYYMNKGNNAMVRCVRAAAKRIEDNKGISHEMRRDFSRKKSSRDALQAVLRSTGSMTHLEPTNNFTDTHALMLKELAEDEGQDEESALVYMKRNMTLLGIKEEFTGHLVDSYLEDSNVVVGAINEEDRRRSMQATISRRLIRDGLLAVEKKMERDAGSHRSEGDFLWSQELSIDDDETEHSTTTTPLALQSPRSPIVVKPQKSNGENPPKATKSPKKDKSRKKASRSKSPKRSRSPKKPSTSPKRSSKPDRNASEGLPASMALPFR